MSVSGATASSGFRADGWLDFEIAGVDAYHLVVADQTYWRGYQSGNRVATDRFLLKPGWRTVYARRVETAVVKVTLADGTVGWGDATEPICPEVICRLASNLLAPLLGGREWATPGDLWQAGYDLNRCRGHQSGYQLLALAAIEVAVWDALGQRAGVPVAALLAAEPAPSLDAYASGLRQGSLGERIDVLRRTVADGAAGAKIFVDGDTDATLSEVSALRSGVSGPWKLMVDALWCYDTVAAAADARRRLAEFEVNWLECPMVPEDFEGHCELARSDGVPVALGEHFFTSQQSAPWFRAKALEVFQPDICRTGFSEGLAQAGLARQEGIRVTPHMGSGSPMVQAAALSFAAAFHADEPCEYQFDLATLLPDAFETAWIRRDGKLVTPDMPGLGISVREESLAKYSATRESWQAGSLARSVTGMRADEGEGQLPLQDRIVPNGASVETLFDGGADFTEGVAAGPDGLIYFSDITRTAMRRGNNPEAGHIWRFDPRDGSCRIFRSPSGMSNGIVFDSLGRMVVAEGADHGGRRITRTDPASGRSFILAAEYAGKRLNSPNDVTVDSEDRIWFTDPRYLGTEPFEQPLMAVYRIEHSGEVRRVVTDARKPNGVALSPDQRTLYVSSADAGTLDGPGTGGLPLPDGESRVLAYDLDDRGTASGRRLLVDLRSMGHPDGMTLDEEGFLYVAVASRHEPQILVLSPEGSAAARIAMPAVPTNVEFGRGPDRNLLYVTAGSGLYRIRLARAGFRWPDRPAGDGPTSQQQPEASR